ncbi:MAG: TldD/PmbA family protein [Bacilli bacterium]
MNKNKFFALAKEVGIETAELKRSASTSISFSIFKNEVESFQISDSISISARGIVNGKFGAASTNKDDKLVSTFLVNEILDTAKLVETEEKAIIFKGSDHYVKRNVFSSALEAYPTDKKIELMLQIEKLILQGDKRITDVQIYYEEESSESSLFNSYGLNLKTKTNYFVMYASLTLREEEEVRTSFKILLSNNIDDIKPDIFAAEAIKEGLAKLHATQCDSGKYKVIMNPESTASLLGAFIDSLSAEDVQKKSSLLANKLNEAVASDKVTIKELPTNKSVFFTGFDDEGVATYNKDLIKKGILKTYLYNLTTADKDGVSSTGNGYGGSKIGIGTTCLTLVPGKSSLEELFQKIGTGIYIEELTGLHAGLDPKSGNFSLQSQGHMIREGKLAEALTLITISGNLFDLWKNVKAVANDSKILTNSTSSPSIYIKELSVSGK